MWVRAGGAGGGSVAALEVADGRAVCVAALFSAGFDGEGVWAVVLLVAGFGGLTQPKYLLTDGPRPLGIAACHFADEYPRLRTRKCQWS